MIRKLFMRQVHDPSRGSFFVGLERLVKNGHAVVHAGLPVYVDKYGQQLVIIDAEV